MHFTEDSSKLSTYTLIKIGLVLELMLYQLVRKRFAGNVYLRNKVTPNYQWNSRVVAEKDSETLINV